MSKQATLSEIGKIATTIVLTLGLITFLVGLGLLRSDATPMATLHTLTSAPAISLPAPPPPPQDTTPPPPQTPDLPHLKIELDSSAPALKASLEQKPELRLAKADFAPDRNVPLAQLTFTTRDLDSQPHLINRPTVTFPAAQRRLGVSEAKVVLEVMINSAGVVTVKRVIDSPHADFTTMAKSFAGRARFTPPKKDGRPVNAVFTWPLILKS